MASLEEYKVQDQLRRTGLEASSQMFQNVQQMMATKRKNDQDDQRRAATAQAAQQWQSGDQKGALATLQAADPDLAKQVFGTYGDQQAKLAADKEQGQLPTQIAAAKAKTMEGKGFKDFNLEGPDGTLIKAKMDKTTGKVYDLGGDEMSGSQLAGMKAGFAPSVGINPNSGEHALYTKGGTTKAIGEPTHIIENGPDGTAVALTAKQNDGLTKFTDEFNKDSTTKDLTSQLNSLHTASQAIENNAPGSQVLEQMRLIRGISPRPAVQEVMALNYGKGWKTTMDSYVTKAEGAGMSPQEQKNYYSMLETFQGSALDEYNQHLHSRVAQAAGNYKVDPGIALKRVAPQMPTPIQQNLKNIQSAPPEDQQAIEWAHKTLLNYNSPKEDSDQALQILRMHGL